MRVSLIVIAVFAILIGAVIWRVRSPSKFQKLQTKVAELIWVENFTEALPLAEHAVEVAEQEAEEWSRTFGGEHSNMIVTGQLSGALLQLGAVQSALENLDESEECFKRAVSVLENAVTEDRDSHESEEPMPPHIDLIEALEYLAVFYSEHGRFEEAVSTHRRKLEISEEIYGKDNPAEAISLVNLGVCFHHLGQFEEAEVVFLRVIKLVLPVASEDEHFVHVLFLALNNLNETYRKQGKPDESAATLNWVLEKATHDLGEDHPAVDSIRKMLDGIVGSTDNNLTIQQM